ncbi:MAG: HpcH/HpaI aldolase/citrate lyase family protein [Sphingorhabdus sp.]
MTANPVTWLFVPGDRADRFEKACASGCDVAIIDGEDAVAASKKEEARGNVARLLGTAVAKSTLAIRINPAFSREGILDLACLISARNQPDYIILPKVEDCMPIKAVAALLDDIGASSRIIALIESAKALMALGRIVSADARLAGLFFGAADMAADLDVPPHSPLLERAREAVSVAATARGLLAIDTPWFDLEDMDGLAKQATAARSIGYRAKAAIHPKHIPVIAAAFQPTEQEIMRAQQILESTNGEAARLDGQMVDAAMVRRAKRILADMPGS